MDSISTTFSCDNQTHTVTTHAATAGEPFSSLLSRHKDNVNEAKGALCTF